MDNKKVEEFIKEYKELCNKHGMEFNFFPTWRQSPEIGDWRLVLNVQVVELKDDKNSGR